MCRQNYITSHAFQSDFFYLFFFWIPNKRVVKYGMGILYIFHSNPLAFSVNTKKNYVSQNRDLILYRQKKEGKKFYNIYIRRDDRDNHLDYTFTMHKTQWTQKLLYIFLVTWKRNFFLYVKIKCIYTEISS